MLAVCLVILTCCSFRFYLWHSFNVQILLQMTYADIVSDFRFYLVCHIPLVVCVISSSFCFYSHAICCLNSINIFCSFVLRQGNRKEELLLQTISGSHHRTLEPPLLKCRRIAYNQQDISTECNIYLIIQTVDPQNVYVPDIFITDIWHEAVYMYPVKWYGDIKWQYSVFFIFVIPFKSKHFIVSG